MIMNHSCHDNQFIISSTYCLTDTIINPSVYMYMYVGGGYSSPRV